MVSATRPRPWSEGANAVRHNLRPFLLIQAMALGLVIAYYTVPAIQAVGDRVADWKAAGGLLFTALSTVIASIALPETAKRITKMAEKLDARELLFRTACFAVLGLMVDTLYRVLALLLGNGTSWVIVAEKAVLDMAIFTPLFSIPWSVIAFLYRDRGFSLSATRASVHAGEFVRRYRSVLITCWAFWIPTLLCVYAMPVKLQFVLFLFAQAAWSLLLVYMSGETSDR